MDDINATNFAQEARNESSAGRANNYNAGIEPARGLLNRPDNFSSGLGNENRALSQAIRSKYAGEFDRSMGRLKFDNVKAANTDHLKKLEVATQMANEEHAMNFQKEMQRKKMAQAKKAMRGQLVGSVLGIVGGVVGGVVAGAGTLGIGAAAGASAGYAAGQGLGQAIGGS